MTPEELRDGLFELQTRRFGRVGELVVQSMARLGQAQNRFHDLFDDVGNQRVEVKFSRVLSSHSTPLEPGSILEAISGARVSERAVAFADAHTEPWDCNIQQVKCAEFDVLYYALLFADRLVCFRVASGDVRTLPGYSDFQHRGNEGEGQFHLQPANLPVHLEQHHYVTLTYGELLDVLRQLDDGSAGDAADDLGSQTGSTGQ